MAGGKEGQMEGRDGERESFNRPLKDLLHSVGPWSRPFSSLGSVSSSVSTDFPAGFASGSCLF